MQYLLYPPYVYNILLGSIKKRIQPNRETWFKKAEIKTGLKKKAKLWDYNSKS